MDDGEFEWNEDKAADHYAKHGVSFETAHTVFKDAFAVEGFDDREAYGEDRFTIIGMAQGRLLFVAYTPRERRLRLISARRATRHEQDDYYEQDG